MTTLAGSKNWSGEHVELDTSHSAGVRSVLQIMTNESEAVHSVLIEIQLSMTHIILEKFAAVHSDCR